eukprot:jgi/Psemu1/250685/estExt_Genewise1Plus.C_190201
MGKNKKRKSHPDSARNDSKSGRTTSLESIDGADAVVAANTIELATTTDGKNNPLYTEQESFLSSLTPKERDHYFCPLSVTPERRAELWMDQAEIGEGLVNRYAWATPTKECLKIFREFSPIVEIGSGSNAYWAKYMKQMGGIDIVAYDRNTEEGGKIIHSETGANRNPRKRNKSGNGTKSENGESDLSRLMLRKGGAEVLKSTELKDRTLFLCYPDEEDAPVQPDGGADDDDLDDSIEEDHQRPLSFGWQCLNEYKGKYVIHVGELAFFDATLNMEQSPWGRSSSSEFQQRLASEFHCIAKIQLPNWLHVRDSISVWKRSEICQMVFVGDEDDESEEIIEYRHIPPEEMLPRRIIAPCMERLLSQDEANNKKTKRGRRREKQKQKKSISMQSSPSKENSDKEEKEKDSKEEKKLRSEYFRLHGRLPPPT